MATKSLTLALLLFFMTMVSISYACSPPPKDSGKYTTTPPSSPPPPPPPTKYAPPPPPTTGGGVTHPPPPPSKGTCPINVLKLGVCANLLDDLLGVKIGNPPQGCCSVIKHLVDAEAALCICTAVKANVLGIQLKATVNLTLLLNYCGKDVPYGFFCP